MCQRLWAHDPTTKREAKAKCLEVIIREERHTTLVKKWLMAMGEEDDLGSFVPHSFAPAIKFELLRNQNAFNASVRGVDVDGIHKDAIYGAMPMREEMEGKAHNVVYHYNMCKSRTKRARGTCSVRLTRVL
jgi:hypothetical protein